MDATTLNHKLLSFPILTSAATNALCALNEPSGNSVISFIPAL